MSTHFQPAPLYRAHEIAAGQAQKAFIATLRATGAFASAPRNVADLLERGQNPRSYAAATLLDVLA